MRTPEQEATEYAENATKQIVTVFDKHSMNLKIFDAYYLVDAFISGRKDTMSMDEVEEYVEFLFRKLGGGNTCNHSYWYEQFKNRAK